MDLEKQDKDTNQKKIKTQNGKIVFGEIGYQELSDMIAQHKYSKIVCLADSNTINLCLPKVLQNLSIEQEIEVLEIPAGETSKCIEICTHLWQTLLEFSIDRKALLLAVGGGVITDIGGFIATTYKRGIDFVNIPTSLLAMVDASVGGKNGVNLGMQKNMVGTFSFPKKVLIDVAFLDTLPGNEMRSGLAEMMKHGLIADKEHWEKFKNLANFTTDDLEQLIFESVSIKNRIVASDLYESDERKKLNFGHTIGHAIESYSHLEEKDFPKLLHGEAVAIGMIIEAYISYKEELISKENYLEIKKTIKNIFNPVEFHSKAIDFCISLLLNDKKNADKQILFTLLNAVGEAVVNKTTKEEVIKEGFKEYLEEN